MDITVSLQIKIQFEGNKKVSVGNVATVVKGLGLEQKVTEAAIQKADEELIEKYCGGMYARGNGNNRYQRAGTVKRHPKTSVGKLVSVISAELATKLTYRDAVKEGKQFIKEEERCRGIQIL